MCETISQLGFACLAPSQSLCVCQSCINVCIDPIDGYQESDCVCPSCWGHPACIFCDNNGKCDPLGESCGCADCALHPICNP